MIYYYTIDDATTIEEWSSSYEEDVDYALAEEIAQYLYDECDGWEWMPKFGVEITFVDGLESRKVIGKYHVYVEYDPTFYAREVK